jgi:hypothetical protein
MAIQEITDTEIVQRCAGCDRENRVALANSRSVSNATTRSRTESFLCLSVPPAARESFWCARLRASRRTRRRVAPGTFIA